MFTSTSAVGQAAAYPTNIVEVINSNEPTVSSFVMATGLGVEHRNIIATVRRHKPSVERFGRVLFEKAPQRTKGGTQQATFVRLNENQALFVGSLSANTTQVVDFKITLIEAFDKTRKQLTHAPQDGLVQVVNELLREVVDLRKGIVRAQKDYGKAYEAKVLEADSLEVANLVKREKIVTYVNTVIRRTLGGSWDEFWKQFELSYNVDVRGIQQNPGETRLDAAIRKGYLEYLYEFINIGR